MKQTIRIIGGKYRGKKLHFPEIENLRPTPDRVRETLFNWLMQTIRGAHCLDAFAGSGALGFEAHSRGAAKVVLVEQAPQAFCNLQTIATQFNSAAIKIVKENVFDYMKKTKEQFDLIFLDPPFSQNYLPECLNLITQLNILKPEGLVYLEYAQEITLDPIFWEKIKLKHAGQVVYGLYKRQSTRIPST